MTRSRYKGLGGCCALCRKPGSRWNSLCSRAQCWCISRPSRASLTQFFQIVQGRSAFEAGSLIVPAALGMMVSSKVAGVLSQSVGPKILIVSSMVLILLGMIAFSQMSIDSGVPQLIGSIFLFGFGLGIGMPALTDTVMAAVPVDDAGIGSAWAASWVERWASRSRAAS